MPERKVPKYVTNLLTQNPKSEADVEAAKRRVDENEK